MMNRNTYIDQLLHELKALEESLHEIKTPNSMPLSFFKESFNKTQEITKLLHKLEFLQVDEMKIQMEKLVYFLSETEKKSKNQENELQLARVKLRELEEQIKREQIQEIESLSEEQRSFENQKDLKEELNADRENETEFEAQRRIDQIKELEKQREIERKGKLENSSTEKQISFEDEKEIPRTMDVKANEQVAKTYLEGFVLPEYKNPNRDKVTPPPTISSTGSSTLPPEYHSPRIIDLKKGVSINDRFLFQRELFNNNSQFN